jgi:hypothetical protein
MPSPYSHHLPVVFLLLFHLQTLCLFDFLVIGIDHGGMRLAFIHTAYMYRPETKIENEVENKCNKPNA